MAKFRISLAFFCVYLVLMMSFTNAHVDGYFNANVVERGLSMNWIEKLIKQKIEGLRKVLRNGDPALGIPVLDPFVRENESIKVNTSLVSASTNVKGFSLVGLSSYSVDDVRVTLSNMSASIRLSWTGIKAKGDYKLDGDLNIPYAGKAPLYGNGPARALVYKVWVEGKIKFNVENDEIVTASDLHLSWDIINPQVRVDGLFGGHELGDTINQLIKDLIPKLDAAYHDKIKKTLEEKILKFINDYLSGVKD